MCLLRQNAIGTTCPFGRQMCLLRPERYRYNPSFWKADVSSPPRTLSVQPVLLEGRCVFYARTLSVQPVLLEGRCVFYARTLSVQPVLLEGRCVFSAQNAIGTTRPFGRQMCLLRPERYRYNLSFWKADVSSPPRTLSVQPVLLEGRCVYCVVSESKVGTIVDEFNVCFVARCSYLVVDFSQALRISFML